MRLGGQVFLEQKNPESWLNALKEAGFRAKPAPLAEMKTALNLKVI
ncbi:hypothetical protein [Paenibacillus sp. GP183]|nr:hypothetical protein [Paenibacillus sp. GP183]